MEKIPEIFNLSSYDYELPAELVAQYPAEVRDSSRLLVVPNKGELFEKQFREIAQCLRRGDLLVLNDTKVFPARLFGKKPTGGQVEFLLLENLSNRRWKVLVRPGRRLTIGAIVEFGENLQARIIERLPDGARIVEFSLAGDEFWRVLSHIGHVPLPHYIERADNELDRERYQTVYARNRGAVAAPTAGLHFTQSLLEELKSAGVEIAAITLHVGWGTFKPIEVQDIREHHMHREFFCISKTAAVAVNSALQDGRRIIAVGTTTMRALESAARKSIPIAPQEEWTDLYIYPGYRFKVVDGMITNFHLPRSSLIVMVSAFAGLERIMQAYEYAISREFRFYSYGDAMLLM